MNKEQIYISLAGFSKRLMDNRKQIETTINNKSLRFEEKDPNGRWLKYSQSSGWTNVYFFIDKSKRKVIGCCQEKNPKYMDRFNSNTFYARSEPLAQDIRYRLSGIDGENWDGIFCDEKQILIDGFLYDLERDVLKPFFPMCIEDLELSANYLKQRKKALVDEVDLLVNLDDVLEYLPDELIIKTRKSI